MRYRLSRWTNRLVAELEGFRAALVDMNVLPEVKPQRTRRRKRLVHDLFCECPKCLPSMTLYAKRLQRRR